MKVNTKRNSFLLFLTACIWGLAFVFQSKGMEYMDPFTFNGVRSLIGAFSLLVFILVRQKLTGISLKGLDTGLTLKAGVCCGLALTVASSLQQFGIAQTTVGKAGFITTLYIIFVPIAGLLFRRRVSKVVWIAAGMAAVGMYLLCMTESLSLNTGDTLVFLCAVAFTAHIMIIDHYSPKTDGVVISFIQFTVCGVLCMIGAFIWGNPAWSQITSGVSTLLYAGIMSCGVAYTLQIIGQNGVNPTVAALLMSLESVVATIAGVIAFKIGFLKVDQTMTARQVAGCVIVFAAVILVQLPKEWFEKKKAV
ncbi:MAG: DMT family transporter [Lachnospiraceae bacterium]|nr:DMT family transporter [Lachnospiraceae bacterium]